MAAKADMKQDEESSRDLTILHRRKLCWLALTPSIFWRKLEMPA